jgi:hypothetical protein
MKLELGLEELRFIATEKDHAVGRLLAQSASSQSRFPAARISSKISLSLMLQLGCERTSLARDWSSGMCIVLESSRSSAFSCEEMLSASSTKIGSRGREICT